MAAGQGVSIMSHDAIHRVISRACRDKQFRGLLLADPARALLAEGIELPAGVSIMVHESADDTLMLVLPGEGTTDRLEKLAMLPTGRVAGLPKGLEMVWKGSMLIVSGELSTESGVHLKRELLKAFSDIDVNMEGVTFMGSGGLSALLVGLKHLMEHNASIRIVNASAVVQSVMDISGFSDMFEMLRLEESGPLNPSQMFGDKVFPQTEFKPSANIDIPLA
jgi:anti-anti-sigma factor